jgi:hypothetical protein
MTTVYTGINSSDQCNATSKVSLSNLSSRNGKKEVYDKSAPHGTEELYILYGYNMCSKSYPTKYIYGTYYNITDTENRINSLCANTGVTESFGSYYSNDGRMTYFINVLPIGDQHTELFTT